MAVLIDSSVFITLERRGQSLGDLNRLGTVGDPLLSGITAAELLTGVERDPLPPRRARRLIFVEQIFAALEVLPFDLPAARAHAIAAAHSACVGTPIGPDDLLIAATALAYGHTVMTDNLSESVRVAGLHVVQPV